MLPSNGTTAGGFPATIGATQTSTASASSYSSRSVAAVASKQQGKPPKKPAANLRSEFGRQTSSMQSVINQLGAAHSHQEKQVAVAQPSPPPVVALQASEFAAEELKIRVLQATSDKLEVNMEDVLRTRKLESAALDQNQRHQQNQAAVEKLVAWSEAQSTAEKPRMLRSQKQQSQREHKACSDQLWMALAQHQKPHQEHSVAEQRRATVCQQKHQLSTAVLLGQQLNLQQQPTVDVLRAIAAQQQKQQTASASAQTPAAATQGQPGLAGLLKTLLNRGDLKQQQLQQQQQPEASQQKASFPDQPDQAFLMAFASAGNTCGGRTSGNLADLAGTISGGASQAAKEPNNSAQSTHSQRSNGLLDQNRAMMIALLNVIQQQQGNNNSNSPGSNGLSDQHQAMMIALLSVIQQQRQQRQQQGSNNSNFFR